MAYIGSEGLIKFQRSAPEPVVIPSSAVVKASNYVTVSYDDWLLAEQVTLIHADGSLQGYVFRDELDRIYLHTTQAGALENATATRVALTPVSTSKPIILAANVNASQVTILSTLLGTLTSVSGETRLRAWPSTVTSFKAAATANPWNIQGELRRWEFSRSAPEIDTGALGEKFGTAIKSVVTGSGSLDFLINFYWRENQNDIDPILRLVQLTDEGCIANSRFYLKKQASANRPATCTGSNTTFMNRAYFFKTNILITNSSINMAAEDLVAGSANFVTTGPIRLLSE